MKNNYDIDDMLRMIQKPTNQKTNLVKAFTCNTEAFNKIISDGYIKLGYSRIRVTAWRFGTTPDQCFKCQKFGHPKEKCQSKVFTCLRCAQDHHYTVCTITDPAKYLCSNCGGNHAACSKQCEMLQKSVEKKQQKQELRQKAPIKQTQTTRVESVYIKNPTTNPTTLNFLKLIVDMFKNLNKVSASVHENPEPLLNLVSEHLGQQYSKQLESILFTESEESDPLFSNIIDNDQE